MSERKRLKREVLDLVASLDPSAPVSQADAERLKSLCDELSAHTLVPAPLHDEKAAEGVWLSRFASFGASHSSGQPLLHETTLKIQSFGNLPNVPMLVTRIAQEIEQSTKAYNNVGYMTNLAGDAEGVVVMYGRYKPVDDNPQRYGVEFHRVGFYPAERLSDAEFRQGFGIEADAVLDKEFGPAQFHSDIVYLDDDLRINYGKLGGFYVLRRQPAPGYSALRR